MIRRLRNTFRAIGTGIACFVWGNLLLFAYIGILQVVFRAAFVNNEIRIVMLALGIVIGGISTFVAWKIGGKLLHLTEKHPWLIAFLSIITFAAADYLIGDEMRQLASGIYSFIRWIFIIGFLLWLFASQGGYTPPTPAQQRANEIAAQKARDEAIAAEIAWEKKRSQEEQRRREAGL